MECPLGLKSVQKYWFYRTCLSVQLNCMDNCDASTYYLTEKDNTELSSIVLSCNIYLESLQILVETGHIGRQASASVTVTDGETVSYLCLKANGSFSSLVLFSSTQQTTLFSMSYTHTHTHRHTHTHIYIYIYIYIIIYI